MKIERISDTQIKFILTHADLAERNIKPTELSYGSEKTHQLFQDMMRQAMAECDFESDNTPLMVEATPMDAENVVVVVTKLTDMSETEQRLNFIPLAKMAARFKRMDIVPPPAESPAEDSISVFSFDTLDTVASLCGRLFGHFFGVSQVYKHSDRYFLLLQNETEDDRNTSDLEIILHEYGQKHISNTISKQYLAERGELLIPDCAVEKLAMYLT